MGVQDKVLTTGLIDKLKARLCGRGFTQKYGVDYDQNLAATLRFDSLRLLFSLCIAYGLRCWLLDVITAYLNSDLDVEIFMEIPEGYQLPEHQKGKDMVKSNAWQYFHGPGGVFREPPGEAPKERCRSVSTPIDGYTGVLPAEENEPRADQREYQSIVGGIILGNGTINLGLVFANTEGGHKYFADAANADNIEDRRTTASFLTLHNGAACVWYSRKQSNVVTSTTEAEYVTLSEGCKSAIWSELWINETGFPTPVPLNTHGDNNGSVCLTKNPEIHARSRHIDVRYHFIGRRLLRALFAFSISTPRTS